LIVQALTAKPSNHGGPVAVTISTFLALFPALFGMSAVQGAEPQTTVRRLIVQDELILRVPLRPRLVMPEIEWVEQRGPRCIDTGEIRGASLSGREHVDFLMFNRSRVRAEFSSDCPALDFYGGFYLKPEDDRLCARRDSVHSRVGGSCRIERFMHLVPRPRR
jgi:hypothetical protein